jgi:hypothetical protein
MRAFAVALLLAAFAGGCGRGNDRDTVEAVTQRFHAALEAGEPGVACELLSTDTRAELESQEQQACSQAIGSLQIVGGELSRVQVYVTNAKADLTSGESAFLSFTEDGWRLSAVGCQPVGGKPADRPYDCELEA